MTYKYKKNRRSRSAYDCILTNLRRYVFLVFYFGIVPIVTADSVCHVDFSRTPQMEELAVRARQLGNEVYPKLLILLGDDYYKLPRHFDIIFKKRLQSKGESAGTLEDGGVTYRLPFFRSKILLNANWLARNPDDLDMILVHEMAHAAQDYKWFRWYKTPSYWMEGIADYSCYKLGYANLSRCPECSLEYPHYTSGFTCAGAFLLYIDATYGSNVVLQLNREIRHGRYSDKFFFKATGKKLDELWVEFKKTCAFTPIAAELDAFRHSLGYENGKPPREVSARFEAYLRQNNVDVDAVHRALKYVDGHPPKDVLHRYEVGLYMRQEAGLLTRSAGEFMLQLQLRGQLPGFSRNETMQFGMPDGGYNEAYPITRIFHCSKKDNTFLYNYTIVQTSKNTSWKLQKAWETGNGRVISEFPINP